MQSVSTGKSGLGRNTPCSPPGQTLNLLPKFLLSPPLCAGFLPVCAVLSGDFFRWRKLGSGLRTLQALSGGWDQASSERLWKAAARPLPHAQHLSGEGYSPQSGVREENVGVPAMHCLLFAAIAPSLGKIQSKRKSLFLSHRSCPQSWGLAFELTV